MKKPVSAFLLLLCFPLYSATKTESQNHPVNDSLIFIEKVYLHVDRDSYYPGDDIWFKSYLVDASDNTLTSHSGNLHVELINEDQKIVDSRILKLSNGLGYGDFHLSDSVKSGIYRLRAYTNYMRNFPEEDFFNKEIVIINSSESVNPLAGKLQDTVRIPEVIFFPEGGSLIDSVASVVAFKALDDKGNGYDAGGEIFSSDGIKIADIKSAHRGMGTFILEPSAGTRYYARIKDKNGNLTEFDLPQSYPEGVTLSVAKNDTGELLLLFKTNMVTLPGILDHDFLLEVSRHNQLIKSYSFRIKSIENFLKVPTSDLPDGIYELTLSGKSNLPVAERLVFIHNNNDALLNITTGKADYSNRDSVSLKISFSDSGRAAKAAFLSVTATDNLFIDNSSLFPSTISSWFLLESDVRGPVEEPSYYFDPSNADRFRDLDILLLTQGWRDFKWKYDSIKYQPEHGFIISGRARKKLADAPLQNSTVTLALFRGGNPLIEVVTLDKYGRFLSEMFDFTGEGRLVASITGEKDNLRGWLILDSTGYAPAPVTSTNHRNAFLLNNNLIGNDSLLAIKDTVITKRFYKFLQYAEITSSIKKKYKLSDTISLGEVKVIAKRIDWTETAQSRSRHYLRGEPDKEIVITPQLETYSNAYQLLRQMMVLKLFPMDPSPRRLSIPLYLINGNRASLSDVKALPVQLIERIDVVNDRAKAMGFGMTMIEAVDSTGAPVSAIGYPDGAISIILKDINDPRFSKSFSHSVSTRFSGYNEPRIFYSPKHKQSLQKDYKPDLRTTLFWEPDVRMSDGEDVYLNFYNGDNSSVVRVTVEGISSDGIPVTGRTEYIVR